MRDKRYRGLLSNADNPLATSILEEIIANLESEKASLPQTSKAHG